LEFELIVPKNSFGGSMMPLRRALWIFAVVLMNGCDSGPQLGAVTGTVTLDDKPLPGARVFFEPIGGGPSSHAETDENGRYELLFAKDEPGATVGRHTVTVSTKQFHIPDSVEKVPAKYNRETQLEEEVVAGGQTINLELKSD
jgi:hypothetical protein